MERQKKRSKHKTAKSKKKKGYRINRNYKDTLFRMIFKDKAALLSLYNAVNNSHYQNPDDLEITTIENVIYMGVKNDISFLIDSYMNLYEAQSTRNPNMPLRGLIYFVHIYQGYLQKKDLDIYSQSQIMIPTPRYIVFYNGIKEEPDRKEYRLSDAFLTKESGCLECTVTMLNINAGHNENLMKGCRLLYEYAFFVQKVRDFLCIYPDEPQKAVDKAVELCVHENVLADFLKKHRGEVSDMLLTYYDEELHIKNEKSQSWKEGHEAGIERGIEAFILDNLEEGIERPRILKKMQKRFSLSLQQAEVYYRRFADKNL